MKKTRVNPGSSYARVRDDAVKIGGLGCCRDCDNAKDTTQLPRQQVARTMSWSSTWLAANTFFYQCRGTWPSVVPQSNNDRRRSTVWDSIELASLLPAHSFATNAGREK